MMMPTGAAAAARAASSPHAHAAAPPSHFSNNKEESSASDSQHTERKPLSFECNICLDGVASPVVTLCGHLYCWPCLYLWMAHHSECPVCKAGISEDNVIPVYGRGADAVDPRTRPPHHNTHGSETSIPDRPRGQRLDPELLRRRRPRNPLGVFSSSPTLGIFPAFFGGGGPFGPTPSPTHHADGSPLTQLEAQQQMQQAFLSRLLLIVGSLVLLCLLTF